MAAATGRLVKHKIGDGASPEVFTNIGARAVSCTINGSAVDITDNDGDGWRQLLDGGGVRSLSVSLQGAFKATTAGDLLLRTKANAQAIYNGEMAFEGAVKYSGTWQCTSFQLSGEVDSAMTYSATIESAGSMTLA
jgi:TP901-1 family phage major tail protein